MNGHNVRLAARLTGYKIDVKTEEEDKKDNSFNSGIADNLNENDFVISDDDFSLEDDDFADENFENETQSNVNEIDNLTNEDFEVDFDEEDK